MNKNQKPGSIVGKVIIYVALIVFALTIIVPVAWVFMASFKPVSYTHLDVYKRQVQGSY